jgi:putative transposase
VCGVLTTNILFRLVGTPNEGGKQPNKEKKSRVWCPHHTHFNKTDMTELRKSYMDFEEPYFYTASILKWQKLLKKDKYKEMVINTLKELVNRKRIVIYGFVIMPNHIHLIWEMLQSNGKERPSHSLMKFTAHCFEKDLREFHPQVMPYFEVDKEDRKYQFWHTDSLAVKLLDRKMAEQKLDYIHLNPLQAHWNLTKYPEEYEWSSAEFYEKGIDQFGFLTHYLERF